METRILSMLFILLLVGCSQKQSEVLINEKAFNTEIADNNIERAKGLMFRKSLDESSGMLFIFPNSEKHSFWMKNTFIPLDIIWIDEDLEIVYIHKNAQPCRETCNSIIPDKEAKYVLEINAGLVEKYGIKIGNGVEIN